MNDNLISLKDVRVQDLHGTKIESLDWQMQAGEAWLVIGPNGGGKADFLQALAGEKQFINNKTNKVEDTIFEKSAETVSLERAALLIQEERDLDESEYIDKIDDEGLFIVIDFDKTALHWSQQSGDGVVLCEADGGYSWWFNDITK